MAFNPAHARPILERDSSDMSSAAGTKNLSWSAEVTYLGSDSPLLQRRVSGTDGHFRCKTCSSLFDSKGCRDKHENYCLRVASSPRSDSGFDSSDTEFRPTSPDQAQLPGRLSVIGLTQIKIPLNMC